MINKRSKVLVLHPDRQHSLQTALALQNEGCLYKYITTVYLKKNSISSFFSSFAPASIRKKFLKHKLDGLDDSNVIMFCQKRMLALSFVSRFLSKDTINRCRRSIINSFNKKCLRYCKRHKFDVLISYDTLSGDVYQELKEKEVNLILDMSAPCFKEMYQNFKKDVELNADDSQILREYLESEKVKNNLINCQKELTTYDYFLAASSYTKDTLMKNGIEESKILVAPYGLTQIKDVTKKKHEGFACTFIGNVTQQKGCHYIFRIAKQLPNVIFNLVGAYDNSYANVPDNCKLHGYLSFSEIKDVLQKTDLCLFLSLADGFGFAATEAMAYGIPVVCSDCAGVRDFVKDSGWIVKPSDMEKVMNIINSCMQNPKELKQRGDLARNSVAGVGWDKYGKCLINFINGV